MRAFQPELLDIPTQESAIALEFGNAGAAERGAVFTKVEIVEFILDLIGWTANRELRGCSLLEPSFGNGEFLDTALRRYLASTGGVGCPHLPKAFMGVEVNQASFENTSRLLTNTLIEFGMNEEEADVVVSGWLHHADFLLLPISQTFTHVVGNPPYLRQEAIPSQLLTEYRSRYTTIYDRADLYVPFFERGMLLLKPQGHLGFICSDRWMKNKYGGPLRERVSIDCHLKTYVDFTDCPAFQEDVVAYPAVTVIKRGNGTTTKAAYRPTVNRTSLNALVPALQGREAHPKVFEADGVVSGSSPWILERFDRLSVIRNLEKDFPLLEQSGCKVGIGVATGADKVFIGGDADLDVEPDRKIPLAKTADIESGEICWKGLYVLNPFEDHSPKLVDLNCYPKLSAYLEKHRDLIEKRHVAKKNPSAWYKTIDRIYPELTTTPKLLIPDIKGSTKVVYDSGELYPHHNLYYVTSDEWELSALKNVLLSRVATAFIETYSVKMRGDFLRFQAQYLRRIRLPRWASIPESLRDALSNCSTEEIDPLVQKIYSLSDEKWEALAS